MSWRRIGLMYALSLVLGFYIYAAQGNRGGAVEVATEPLSPLVPTLAARVSDVALRWDDIVLQLRRDGEGWTVIEPRGATITDDLVGALLDTLTTIAPIDVVDDGASDSEEFGLSRPAVLLRVTADLDAPIDIAIGSHNPTRTAVYAARLDEDRAYLIGLAARYYVQLLFEELEGQLPTSPDSISTEPSATR